MFDEIHKYRSWRGFLKGLYDGRRRGQRILVTGSARLDLYRYGDDARDRSLRYLKLRYPQAEAWQISAAGRKDYVTEEGIRVAPALELLAGLV